MIPIGCNIFVFGRLLKDSAISIYSFVSMSEVCVSDLACKKELFDPGVFDDHIVNGRWRVIGNLPFLNEDESWPSPKFIQDVINPKKYRIYYKGVLRDAEEHETVGLEMQAMYKPEALVHEVRQRLLPEIQDLSGS
jgi:hypothetical protein